MQYTLYELDLLDAPADERYDKITQLAREVLDVPAAHVSIADFDGQRIFYKSQRGHPDELAEARELPMELTYCQHVAKTKGPMIVTDASVHPLLVGTPALSEGQPMAYLGMPIEAPGNRIIGGLCMMNPLPRDWTEGEIAMARKLAACVTDLIRLRAETLKSERMRREQSEFAYSISHDLRSPTATMQMVLEEVACEADRLSPDVREILDEGRQTARRMAQQIEDVLAYSRAVGAEIEREAVSLDQLVGEILTDLKADIARTGIAIDTGPLPELRGSRLQLRLLLQNLISNAIKFQRPGVPGKIHIQAGEDPAGHDHLIGIADNGIGIPPEAQEKIFKMFSRLNLREDYEGSGIGLALVRRIAENHGGRIEVTSDGATGSTFTIRLPKEAA